MKKLIVVYLIVSFVGVMVMSYTNYRSIKINDNLYQQLKTTQHKYHVSDSLWTRIMKTCYLIRIDRIKKIEGNVIVKKQPFEK